MTLLRNMGVLFPLLAFWGFDFCYFLFPEIELWLFFAGILSLVPFVVLSVAALIKRRWRMISVAAAVWLFLCAGIAGFGREWLSLSGFYVRAQLTHNYLSKCRLTEFEENGTRQTAGFCEGFDRGEYFDFIVYDTTGEFVRPAAQRTPEWKRVMSVATEEAVVSKDRTAYHLFGKFYAVVVGILDMKG